MNRRKFFGASTGAVVAGPSVLNSAGVAAMDCKPYAPAYYGSAVGYDTPVKAINHRECLRGELDRARARLHELESGGLDAVQSSRLMGYGEAYGNIEALKSVSPVSKALMRNKANAEREWRDQVKSVRSAIEDTLKKLAGLP